MKLHIGNNSINLNNASEMLNLSLNDVVLCTLTVIIGWHAAPNDITLVVNGEDFYHYERLTSTTSTHTHKIPVGSVVTFKQTGGPGTSIYENVSGNIEVSYNDNDNNNYLRASTFTVNGDGVIEIYSTVEK